MCSWRKPLAISFLSNISQPDIEQIVRRAVDLDTQLASPVHLLQGTAFPTKAFVMI